VVELSVNTFHVVLMDLPSHCLVLVEC